MASTSSGSKPRPAAMEYPGSSLRTRLDVAAAAFTPSFPPPGRDFDTESRVSLEGSVGSGSSCSRRRRRRSGAAKRLPVFSGLQPTDSGSERGSSTRGWSDGRSSPTDSLDSLTASFDSLAGDGRMAARTIVSDLIAKLRSPDETKAATAAKYVCDIVRDTCPAWRQNQTQICRSPEVLNALTSLLHSQSERCRFEACRALGNIAYQNPGLLGKLAENAEMNATGAADALETDSCMNIVTTNGMLEGLMSTLRFGNINSKHEAARVINNCAAYSEQAAETIAKYTGIIMELKALCGEKGRAQRTRAKAIGALSCLSTYPVARSYLIAVGVVEEALIPTLQQKKKIFGDGDEYKAMRADAVIAMANLVGREENSAVAKEPDGLKIVVKCLRYGLERKVWAGISWTAYSSLLPLSNLTICDGNNEVLTDLGLVELLIRCLTEHVSRIEVSLAISSLNQMVFCLASRQRMMLCGAKDVLSNVIANESSYPEVTGKMARRIIWMLNRQNEVQKHRQTSARQGGQLFLNFSTANTQLAQRINFVRDSLEGTDYVVWMNPTASEGEMTDAIVSSSVILLCVSRAFKEDTLCRISYEVARDLKKHIFLLIMEDSVKPDCSWGWLSRVVSSCQSIAFHGDLHTALYTLHNALSPFDGSLRRGKSHSSPTPTLSTHSHTPPHASFSPSSSPAIRSMSATPVPSLRSSDVYTPLSQHEKAQVARTSTP